jgi:hypothetical protein
MEQTPILIIGVSMDHQETSKIITWKEVRNKQRF